MSLLHKPAKFHGEPFCKDGDVDRGKLSQLHGPRHEAVLFVLTFLLNRRVLPINKHGNQGI